MAIVLALVSSIMWGIADFLGGVATKKSHVALVVGLSQIFGLGTVTVVGVFTGFDYTAEVIPWAVAASLSGFAGLSLFYQALSIGRMGIVSPIASLGVMVPLAFGLLGGERPSQLQIVGIIAAVVGIVLASGPELTGDADPKPVIFAVGAAAGFGVCLYTISRGSEFSVISTMTGMRMVTAILCTIWIVVVASKDRELVKPSWTVIAVVGFFDVMANVTFGYATSMDLLSLVSVLGSLYPVFTVLLALVFLKERLLPVQYVGVVAALTGVGFIAGG